MVLAQRNISAEEWADISARLQDAFDDVNDRVERLEVVYEQLEQDLVYLGVSAVEDR